MRRTVVTIALAAAAVAAIAPAEAGRRRFSVDPFSIRTTSGAGKVFGSFGDAGISVPQGGQFGFGFIVPKPYRTDSNISITVHWHVADPNCGVELIPDFVDRTRPGHVATSGAASGGLIPDDGSVVLVGGSMPRIGMTKKYLLGPNQGFDQRSGDAILLGFLRGSGTSDTCGSDLIVSGIEVEYLTP